MNDAATSRDYILVVEDDLAMQLTIASILEDEGYAVTCARHGREALVQLEGQTPALIVLDLAMPEMDGYTFVGELTRRGLRPAIPLLLVTADGYAEAKAATLGAEGYLMKPFTLVALVEQVNRLLGRAVD